MLVTDKVNQLATDSNLVHSWVHGTGTVATEGGAVRTPAKLIADKDLDIDAAISAAIGGEFAVVTSVADNMNHVNAVGANIVEVKAAADNLVTIAQVGSNMSKVDTVSTNMSDVNAVVTNLALIQAAPANADIAATAISFLATYIDQVVMNVTFPLDLGLIIDPVGPVNTFDLGAI